MEEGLASAQPALNQAFTGYGGRAYGPYLGGGRAAERVATSIHQHLIGRLPKRRSSRNSYSTNLGE